MIRNIFNIQIAIRRLPETQAIVRGKHPSRLTPGMGCYIFLFFITVWSGANAQNKTVNTEEQAWMAYFNQARISNKFGLWTDIHLRTKEKLFKDLSQGIFRLGATYYLTDMAKLTGGYAFVNHFPADNHQEISQPEHRSWQQVQWHTGFAKLRLMQWFRLEQRFRRKIKDDDELASGYFFNHRIRYNILTQFPLSRRRFEKGTFSFVVSDEAFVNFGKQIVNNYFDQNRFFAGFHFHLNAHDNLQLGYMNVFQQLPAGNVYRSINAIRVFYFQNINLKKESNKQKSK